MMKVDIDKAWSLKHEYHLNKNNMIFKKDFPLKRLLAELTEENNKLKKKDYENSPRSL